jgi:methionyl-tRNA formyltransferase
MTEASSLRCFIIGEGTLPLLCAEMLLQGGYTLSGVISSSSQLREWALERGVPVYSPDELMVALKQQPFDYLFSIVNPLILPVEALELPKQWAINYHDGPLPRYAGMYATSWALINQEKRHGITLHRMSPKVDAGEVLIQPMFDISADETALTLNFKCYEAAIRTFQKLVQELPLGGIKPQPQDLTRRSLYPRRRRPQNGCTFDWKMTAAELGALFRGLNFGRYPNPLGMPKIFTGSDFWLVKEMVVIEEPTSAEPGIITKLSEQALQVATAQGQVCLNRLLNVDGQPLSLFQSGLAVGKRLPELEPGLAKRLSDLHSTLSDYEPFWIRRLEEIDPLCLPASTAEQLPGQNNIEWVESTASFPPEWERFIRNYPEPDQRGLLTLTAWLIFLARLADVERFDLAIQSSVQNRLINGLEGFFANSLPLCILFNLEWNFYRLIALVRDEYELLCRHGTYARDLLVRSPDLSHLDGGPYFPVGVALVDRMDENVKPFVSELFCTISLDTGDILWSYKAQAYTSEDIRRMQGQFNQLLQEICRDPEQAVGRLPWMDSVERQSVLVD